MFLLGDKPEQANKVVAAGSEQPRLFHNVQYYRGVQQHPVWDGERELNTQRLEHCPVYPAERDSNPVRPESCRACSTGVEPLAYPVFVFNNPPVWVPTRDLNPWAYLLATERKIALACSTK